MKVQRPKYFSLTELLIVIAILAVLASLLSPSLTKAIKASYALKCSKTLGQFATASFLYQYDFNNANATAPSSYYSAMAATGDPKYPDPYGYGYNNSWAQQLNRGGYLGIGKDLVETFVCDEYFIRRNGGAGIAGTYQYSNKYWAQYLEQCYGMSSVDTFPNQAYNSCVVYNVIQIANPSSFLFINETFKHTSLNTGSLGMAPGDNSYRTYWSSTWDKPDHLVSKGITGVHDSLTRSNVAFFDGHVEMLSWFDIVKEKYHVLRK